MQDLNEAVASELDGVHYATMVAVGFHDRRGLLVMTNAGHPPAFWYRANREEWTSSSGNKQKRASSGTPLGLLRNMLLDRMIVKPEAGRSASSCTPTVCQRPPILLARSWVETAS